MDPLTPRSLRTKFDTVVRDADRIPVKRNAEFDRDIQVAKRRLWRRLDEIRGEIAETTKEGDKEPPIVSAEEVRSVEKKLSLNAKGRFSIYALVRMLAVVAWLILAFPWMLIAAPVRIIYPILRKMGYHSNHLPLDVIHVTWCKVICLLGGLQVITEGIDYANSLDGVGALLLFQHSSNLDGFLIQAGCPLAFKWVGKKSLLKIPIIGWLGYAYGAILFIDRENQQKAIKTLNHARSVMHRYRRCVAIAPEGTRSLTGQLVPFKKGPFHLALDVKAPLLPVVLFGASELWPKNQLFTDVGSVVVSYIKPISVADYENFDHNQLLSLVREKMLDHMEAYPTRNPPSRNLTLGFRIAHYVGIVAVFALLYYQTKWFLGWVF